MAELETLEDAEEIVARSSSNNACLSITLAKVKSQVILGSDQDPMDCADDLIKKILLEDNRDSSRRRPRKRLKCLGEPERRTFARVHCITYNLESVKPNFGSIPDDNNHGSVSFFFWFDSMRMMTMYALLRSGLTSVWQKFMKWRDVHFPERVARAFLRPNPVLSLRVDECFGFNIGTRQLRPNGNADILSLDSVYLVKGLTSHLRPEIALPAGLLADKIPWELQAGQIKVPMKRPDIFDDIEANIKDLIVILDERTNKRPEYSFEWDEIYHMRLLNFKKAAYFKRLITEELQKCLSNRSYVPSSFSRSDKLKAEPAPVFEGCNDVRLVKIMNSQPCPMMWTNKDGSRVQCKHGADITVEDIIRSINSRQLRGREGDLDMHNFSISWSGPNDEEFCQEIYHFIGALIVDNDEGTTAIKIGNRLYEPLPSHELSLNLKFQSTLKACLLDLSKDFNLPAWTRTMKEKKPALFDAIDVARFCVKDIEDVQQAADMIGKILLNEFSIRGRNGENCIYRKIPLNCSMLPGSRLSDLDSNQILSEDTIPKGRTFKLCSQDRESNKYYVACPVLTTDMLEQIDENVICISRLLQFLRSKVTLSEGDYNELFHLSNCECHSNGWIFVVGDRILCGRNGDIELFDVLAHHKSQKKSYLLHVKHASKGSLTTAVRVCSAQVNVAVRELGSRDPVHILESFYDKATSLNNDASIHRRMVKKVLEDHFSSKEEFHESIFNSTIHVCLTLADDNATNGANAWRHFKEFRLGAKFTHFPWVDKLRKLDLVDDRKSDTITHNFCVSTEKFVKTKLKKQLLNADEVYEEILEEIYPNAEISPSEIMHILTPNNFQSKSLILCLQSLIQGKYSPKIQFGIVPIN